ncbi:hypothetical protein D3C80_1360120 [compost metagenome]
MEFHLIDSRYNFGIAEQVLQMMNLKIADANRTDFPIFIHLFKSTPRIIIFAFYRPMNQEQINIFKVKLVHAGFKSLQRCFIALLAVPYLGSNEQLLSR